MTSPANWYPDPMGRFQFRYWDGAIWTDHVSTNGTSYVDPLNPAPQPVVDGVQPFADRSQAAQQMQPEQQQTAQPSVVEQPAVTHVDAVQPNPVTTFITPASHAHPDPTAYVEPQPEPQRQPEPTTQAEPTPTPVQQAEQPQQAAQYDPQAAAPAQYSAQQFQADDMQQRIQAQVQGDGWRGAGIAPTGGGGGTLFTEQVIVVNQKAKIFELTNQYAVFDGAGNPLGSMTQVGQSGAKKVLRAVSNLDQFMTHNLEIRDNYGQAVMSVTRPRKVFKSTVIVTAPNGGEIGKIVQENVFGKIHFALVVGEQQIGSIRAENWRAWNFSIQDIAGTEVARITKTFEGVLKTVFTTADNYVLQIHYQLPQPLLALVVASALSVDTALKQDSR